MPIIEYEFQEVETPTQRMKGLVVSTAVDNYFDQTIEYLRAKVGWLMRFSVNKRALVTNESSLSTGSEGVDEERGVWMCELIGCSVPC